MKNALAKRAIGNSRGQFVIEAVLLMIIGVSILTASTRMIREGKWLNNLVAEPWGKISGMIESGVWQDSSSARSMHPNRIARHRTPFPRR